MAEKAILFFGKKLPVFPFANIDKNKFIFFKKRKVNIYE